MFMQVHVNKAHVYIHCLKPLRMRFVKLQSALKLLQEITVSPSTIFRAFLLIFQSFSHTETAMTILQ